MPWRNFNWYKLLIDRSRLFLFLFGFFPLALYLLLLCHEKGMHDLAQGDNGQRNMSTEQLRLVFDLVHKGNRAFHERRFREVHGIELPSLFFLFLLCSQLFFLFYMFLLFSFADSFRL